MTAYDGTFSICVFECVWILNVKKFDDSNTERNYKIILHTFNFVQTQLLFCMLQPKSDLHNIACEFNTQKYTEAARKPKIKQSVKIFLCLWCLNEVGEEEYCVVVKMGYQKLPFLVSFVVLQLYNSTKILWFFIVMF